MVSAYLLTITISVVSALQLHRGAAPLAARDPDPVAGRDPGHGGPALDRHPRARAAGAGAGPGDAGGRRDAGRRGRSSSWTPSDWADLWGNFGHLKQLRWSQHRQRLRGRLAVVFGAGIAGPARARGARAAPEGHSHRRGAGRGQRAVHGAAVHRAGGRGGAHQPHRAAGGAAGAGRAEVRRHRPAHRAGAHRRRAAARRRQPGLHRLLQRLQGGRRARLPAGGDLAAQPALRHAARRDHRHHRGGARHPGLGAGRPAAPGEDLRVRLAGVVLDHVDQPVRAALARGQARGRVRATAWSRRWCWSCPG